MWLIALPVFAAVTVFTVTSWSMRHGDPFREEFTPPDDHQVMYLIRLLRRAKTRQDRAQSRPGRHRLRKP